MLCERVIADGSTMIWTTVSKTLCCVLGVNCGVAPHDGMKMVRASGGIECVPFESDLAAKDANQSCARALRPMALLRARV